MRVTEAYDFLIDGFGDSGDVLKVHCASAYPISCRSVGVDEAIAMTARHARIFGRMFFVILLRWRYEQVGGLHQSCQVRRFSASRDISRQTAAIF